MGKRGDAMTWNMNVLFRALMKTLIISMCFVFSVASTAQATATDNVSRSIRRINSLIKNGVTDTDTIEIDGLFVRIEKDLFFVTSEKQTELWESNPWFAGVACYWAISHLIAGNDCAVQCGGLADCLTSVSMQQY